ncbi:hypothetical protein [Arthrobacter yangruifuii]|nr:hypothetical protein [Arthrobacter yangruifuii]
MSDSVEIPRDFLEPDERRRQINAAVDSILKNDSELLARLADA